MSTKHYGEILKSAIEESGLSVSQISVKSGVPRKTIHRLFHDKDAGLDHLLKIGGVIGYEYLRDIPEFKKMFVSLPSQTDQDNLSYKVLYFEILEKYTKVLEEQAKYLRSAKK